MNSEDDVKKMFAYRHLPENLRKVSKPIHDLAVDVFNNTAPCEERTIALRKLWEAKNYLVWCAAN